MVESVVVGVECHCLGVVGRGDDARVGVGGFVEEDIGEGEEDGAG